MYINSYCVKIRSVDPAVLKLISVNHKEINVGKGISSYSIITFLFVFLFMGLSIKPFNFVAENWKNMPGRSLLVLLGFLAIGFLFVYIRHRFTSKAN